MISKPTTNPPKERSTHMGICTVTLTGIEPVLKAVEDYPTTKQYKEEHTLDIPKPGTNDAAPAG